jgi:hypothetical protein
LKGSAKSEKQKRDSFVNRSLHGDFQRREQGEFNSIIKKNINITNPHHHNTGPGISEKKRPCPEHHLKENCVSGRVTSMNRITKNKPQISPYAKSVRAIRRLNLNRTYTPLKIGVIAGYILIGMYAASSSMSGLLIGMMLRIAGL